jgi:hypothetical protein
MVISNGVPFSCRKRCTDYQKANDLVRKAAGLCCPCRAKRQSCQQRAVSQLEAYSPFVLSSRTRRHFHTARFCSVTAGIPSCMPLLMSWSHMASFQLTLLAVLAKLSVEIVHFLNERDLAKRTLGLQHLFSFACVLSIHVMCFPHAFVAPCLFS